METLKKLLSDADRAALQAAIKDLPWQKAEILHDLAGDHLGRLPNWRRSPQRLKRNLFRIARYSGLASLGGRSYLDFGCGEFNPLALSAAMYLNGAARAHAVDIIPCAEALIARGLYEFLRDCAVHPDDYCCFGTRPEDIVRRIQQFRLAALRDGDWRRAVETVPIFHDVCGTADYPCRFGAVDLVASNSVLEHIVPPEGVIADLAAVLAPGGVMVHYVDLTDHDRKMSKDPLARWAFLTTDDTRGAKHSNRVRLGAMLAMFREAGLSVHAPEIVEVKPPATLRPLLLPAFATLSDADLATVAATLVSVRP